MVGLYASVIILFGSLMLRVANINHDELFITISSWLILLSGFIDSCGIKFICNKDFTIFLFLYIVCTIFWATFFYKFNVANQTWVFNLLAQIHLLF